MKRGQIVRNRLQSTTVKSRYPSYREMSTLHGVKMISMNNFYTKGRAFLKQQRTLLSVSLRMGDTPS